MDCPRCEGFGTVDKYEACPKCKGAGKTAMKFGNNPRGAPCTRCRGRGQIAVRGECPACKGGQKVRCSVCKGKGRVSSKANASAVVMAYSPWEWLLRYFKRPVKRNSCPQRSLLGGYPIVKEYLALRSGDKSASVKTWGEFQQVNYPWRMTAEVEFQNKSGQARTQMVEFIVMDRVLGKSRPIR